MEFDITIRINTTHYKMRVKRVYEGSTLERFEISGGGKLITVQTNFTFIVNSKQRKSPDWKILNGEVKNGPAFALTIREIERYLKDNPKLPSRKNV
jgi:hypothetical protein